MSIHPAFQPHAWPPAAAELSSFGDSGAAPLAAPRLPVTGARRVVLLVVGPDRRVRWRMEMALRMSGYQVLVADDADDALALLQDGLHPELMLADADARGVAAADFVQLVRQRLQGGPIVMLGRQDAPLSDADLLDRFERLSLLR